MVRETLTGSRIRERRVTAGLRQVDLARSLGISASYLNLIEHNRRRIGGKLLLEIARALEVEPTMLAEGVAEALVASLGEAAAQAETATVETDRTDEFARRFPGWSQLVVQQSRRLATLERTVEALTDRLAHDPQLATSLHEVLSTAAAVRSVASILAEPGDLDPVWQQRFTRNLNDDSLRLAESSKSLVAYLDATESGSERRALPREEAESIIAAHDYVFDALEKPGAALEDIPEVLANTPGPASRKLLHAMLTQYLADAQRMPRVPFLRAFDEVGGDVLGLARHLEMPLPDVMRRLVVMPSDTLPARFGLVICDAAGSVLFHKPAGDFTVPRAVAPCPLWPLFIALHRPLVPVTQRITQAGRGPAQFDCLAVAVPRPGTEYAVQPQVQAFMLLREVDPEGENQPEVAEVGSSCRVCTRLRCAARREPSLMTPAPA